MSAAGRRALRFLGLMVVVGVALLPAAALAAPGGQQSAVSTAVAADDAAALDRYGSCLNAQHQGDLLLLIDTSGSIETTDPDDARVAAAEYLLTQLQAYTAANAVQLTISVAGFADQYQTVGDWTPLDAATLPQLSAAVDSFRDRTGGFETDYDTALQGARQAFAQRSQTTPETPRCQALAWFTDGELAISARLSDADQQQYGLTKPYAEGVPLDSDAAALTVTDAARTDICTPRGLADQVRAAGIVTLAVGLAPPGQQEPDFSLLESISNGTDAAGTACGSLLQPSPGKFYRVADFDDLILAFDRFSTPGQAPLEQTKKVCQGGPCASEEHVFVLDNSIPTVHALATADAAGLTVLLSPPGGAAITLTNPGVGTAQTVSQDGNDISFTWQSPTAVSMDLRRGAGSTLWAGKWSITFVDPSSSTPDAVSRTNIHLSADLYPALTNSSGITWSSGAPVPGLVFGIVDGAGNPVDPATLAGTVSLSAQLVEPGAAGVPMVSGVGAAELAAPVAADLTAARPGPAVVQMVLQVTTAATVDAAGAPLAGTALAARTVELPVLITPPVPPTPPDQPAPPAPVYPSVAARVDFGTTDQLSTQGGLTVTGPGCVWLDPAAEQQVFGAPQSVGQVAVSTPTASAGADCLAVPAGESAELPLTLTVEHSATGGVNGKIAVLIAPLDQPDAAYPVPVAFAGDLHKPVDPPWFIGTFVIALLLALGIPLALMYLAKYLSTRIPRVPMAHVTIPVSVSDGQLLRDGNAFAFRDSDFRTVVSVSGAGRRRLPVGRFELRTAVGWSPVGAGDVVVQSPGMVGASTGHPPWTKKALQARLPLAAHNHWAILHDPAGDPLQAELLVLVDATDIDRARPRITDEINGRATDLLGALQAEVRRSGPADGPPPVPVGVGVSGPGDSQQSGNRHGFAFDDDPPATRRGFDFGPDD